MELRHSLQRWCSSAWNFIVLLRNAVWQKGCIPEQGGKGCTDTSNKQSCTGKVLYMQYLSSLLQGNPAGCPRRSSNALSSAEVEHNPGAISSAPEVSGGFLIHPCRCNGNFRSAPRDLHPLVKCKQAERKREVNVLFSSSDGDRSCPHKFTSDMCCRQESDWCPQSGRVVTAGRTQRVI